MLLLIDRIIKKIARAYRKAVFRKKIKCPHKNFSLVGNVHLINTNVTLGNNVTLYPDVMLHGDGPIVIGDNVSIGNNTIIYSSKNAGVYIGNCTQIAAQTYIIDTDHGIAAGELIMHQHNVANTVTIGNDVWIAAGCKILRGSTIEDGVIIGANSVVKGEIQKNAVAVGTPAKVIKYRE